MFYYEFPVKRYRRECYYSSSESDSPLAELRQRISTRKVREKTNKILCLLIMTRQSSRTKHENAFVCLTRRLTCIQGRIWYLATSGLKIRVKDRFIEYQMSKRCAR